MRAYPMVWVACAFTVGILLYFYSAYTTNQFLLSGLPVAALSLLLLGKNFRVTGILVLSVAVGHWVCFVHTYPPHHDLLRQDLPKSPMRIQGRVIEQSRKSTFSESFTIQLEAIAYNQNQALATGLVQVKVPKGFFVCGERIVAEGKMERLQRTHPYTEYLYKKGIYHQLLVKNPNKIIKIDTIKNISWYAGEYQRYLLDQTEKYFTNRTNANVANALILGYTRELAPELRKNYATSGAAHILALSGMHVMLLLSFLGILQKAIPRWVFGTAVGGLLMFYVLATGASASVVRAGLVGGLGILGRMFYRRSIALNVLAVSWLLQLIWKPNTFFEIGFQLSYAAVWGILVMQPLFKKLQFKNVFTKYLYDVLTITLSAQLFTTPLVLFYFAKFPTYFLVTNIALGFWSSITLLLGFTFILINSFKIEWLSQFFAYILEFFIQGMNTVVEWVKSLPYAQVSIQLDLKAVILSYIMIAVLLFSFRYGLKVRNRLPI